MSGPETIHVVDDDAAVRQSLAFLLRTADYEVRTYDSPTALLAILPSIRSGCIISDVRMPELDGVELLRRIKNSAAEVPVILMTAHGDIKLAVEAMRAGAADFVEKPFDDEALLASIRLALRRKMGGGQDSSERQELQERLATLSTRETEVLQGLVAGNPNKTIAFDLGISARTVEVYRAHLMTKMKAGSLAELVRMAIVAQLPPAGR